MEITSLSSYQELLRNQLHDELLRPLLSFPGSGGKASQLLTLQRGHHCTEHRLGLKVTNCLLFFKKKDTQGHHQDISCKVTDEKEDGKPP